MVSNINLAAPELEQKRSAMTSKGTLIAAILLAAVVLGVYAVLAVMKNSLNSQKTDLDSQIQQEKMKLQGPAFSELADFQGRLLLLKKIIVDHNYPESYLRDFSKYILPEVKLTSFSWENGGKLVLKGLAPNFDSFSKQVILLRTYPKVASLEFKQASETLASTSTSGSFSGVQFEIDATLAPDALNKVSQ